MTVGFRCRRLISGREDSDPLDLRFEVVILCIRTYILDVAANSKIRSAWFLFFLAKF